MLRCNAGWRRASSSRAARTLGADSESSEAPSQWVRSVAGTWIVIVADRAMASRMIGNWIQEEQARARAERARGGAASKHEGGEAASTGSTRRPNRGRVGRSL